MTEFDVNKELEVIKLENHLYQLDENFEFRYFYHSHRLGTRVPLFLILCDELKWMEESIVYFCKIGNVLSFRLEEIVLISNNIDLIMTKLFRRYGSNYGILVYFGEKTPRKMSLFDSIVKNRFLNSEINIVAEVNRSPESKSSRNNFIDIQVKLVRDFDLQNALILERIQRQLKLQCLDWTWQYEQSDKLFLFSKLVFKNLSKWKNTDSCGKFVEGTRIIPMKLMRDNDEEHSPNHILSKFPNIGLIIDISNDEGSYDKSKFIDKGVQYKRIQIESKVIPSSTDVFEFIQTIKKFCKSNQDDEKIIIVHCHYGYNRTGMMICAYLIEELHVSVHEALANFKAARPPGIKHQNYIDKLILRYSEKENQTKEEYNEK